MSTAERREAIRLRLAADYSEALADLVDFDDPDILYVAAAVSAVGGVGLDVTDPVVLRLAIALGHKRAARATEHDLSLLTPEAKANSARRAQEAWDAVSVVYYMRIGNRCKIGYSLSLKKRLATFNPEELLATEPGGVRREQERHRQFAELRTHGEWFRYEGALVEHVARLRAA